MSAYCTLIVLHKSTFSDSCVRDVTLDFHFSGVEFHACAIQVGSLEITKKLQKRLPCVQVAWTTGVRVVAYYPKG